MSKGVAGALEKVLARAADVQPDGWVRGLRAVGSCVAAGHRLPASATLAIARFVEKSGAPPPAVADVVAFLATSASSPEAFQICGQALLAAGDSSLREPSTWAEALAVGTALLQQGAAPRRTALALLAAVRDESGVAHAALETTPAAPAVPTTLVTQLAATLKEGLQDGDDPQRAVRGLGGAAWSVALTALVTAGRPYLLSEDPAVGAPLLHQWVAADDTPAVATVAETQDLPWLRSPLYAATLLPAVVLAFARARGVGAASEYAAGFTADMDAEARVRLLASLAALGEMTPDAAVSLWRLGTVWGAGAGLPTAALHALCAALFTEETGASTTDTGRRGRRAPPTGHLVLSPAAGACLALLDIAVALHGRGSSGPPFTATVAFSDGPPPAALVELCAARPDAAAALFAVMPVDRAAAALRGLAEALASTIDAVALGRHPVLATALSVHGADGALAALVSAIGAVPAAAAWRIALAAAGGGAAAGDARTSRAVLTALTEHRSGCGDRGWDTALRIVVAFRAGNAAVPLARSDARDAPPQAAGSASMTLHQVLDGAGVPAVGGKSKKGGRALSRVAFFEELKDSVRRHRWDDAAQLFADHRAHVRTPGEAALAAPAAAHSAPLAGLLLRALADAAPDLHRSSEGALTECAARVAKAVLEAAAASFRVDLARAGVALHPPLTAWPDLVLICRLLLRTVDSAAVAADLGAAVALAPSLRRSVGDAVSRAVDTAAAADDLTVATEALEVAVVSGSAAAVRPPVLIRYCAVATGQLAEGGREVECIVSLLAVLDGTSPVEAAVAAASAAAAAPFHDGLGRAAVAAFDSLPLGALNEAPTVAAAGVDCVAQAVAHGGEASSRTAAAVGAAVQRLAARSPELDAHRSAVDLLRRRGLNKALPRRLPATWLGLAVAAQCPPRLAALGADPALDGPQQRAVAALTCPLPGPRDVDAAVLSFLAATSEVPSAAAVALLHRALAARLLTAGLHAAPSALVAAAVQCPECNDHRLAVWRAAVADAAVTYRYTSRAASSPSRRAPPGVAAASALDLPNFGTAGAAAAPTLSEAVAGLRSAAATAAPTTDALGAFLRDTRLPPVEAAKAVWVAAREAPLGSCLPAPAVVTADVLSRGGPMVVCLRAALSLLAASTQGEAAPFGCTVVAAQLAATASSEAWLQLRNDGHRSGRDLVDAAFPGAALRALAPRGTDLRPVVATLSDIGTAVLAAVRLLEDTVDRGTDRSKSRLRDALQLLHEEAAVPAAAAPPSLLSAAYTAMAANGNWRGLLGIAQGPSSRYFQGGPLHDVRAAPFAVGCMVAADCTEGYVAEAARGFLATAPLGVKAAVAAAWAPTRAAPQFAACAAACDDTATPLCSSVVVDLLRTTAPSLRADLLRRHLARGCSLCPSSMEAVCRAVPPTALAAVLATLSAAAPRATLPAAVVAGLPSLPLVLRRRAEVSTGPVPLALLRDALLATFSDATVDARAATEAKPTTPQAPVAPAVPVAPLRPSPPVAPGAPPQLTPAAAVLAVLETGELPSAIVALRRGAELRGPQSLRLCSAELEGAVARRVRTALRHGHAADAVRLVAALAPMVATPLPETAAVALEAATVSLKHADMVDAQCSLGAVGRLVAAGAAHCRPDAFRAYFAAVAEAVPAVADETLGGLLPVIAAFTPRLPEPLSDTSVDLLRAASACLRRSPDACPTVAAAAVAAVRRVALVASPEAVAELEAALPAVQAGVLRAIPKAGPDLAMAWCAVLCGGRSVGPGLRTPLPAAWLPDTSEERHALWEATVLAALRCPSLTATERCNLCRAVMGGAAAGYGSVDRVSRAAARCAVEGGVVAAAERFVPAAALLLELVTGLGHDAPASLASVAPALARTVLGQRAAEHRWPDDAVDDQVLAKAVAVLALHCPGPDVAAVCAALEASGLPWPQYPLAQSALLGAIGSSDGLSAELRGGATALEAIRRHEAAAAAGDAQRWAARLEAGGHDAMSNTVAALLAQPAPLPAVALSAAVQGLCEKGKLPRVAALLRGLASQGHLEHALLSPAACLAVVKVSVPSAVGLGLQALAHALATVPADDAAAAVQHSASATAALLEKARPAALEASGLLAVPHDRLALLPPPAAAALLRAVSATHPSLVAALLPAAPHAAQDELRHSVAAAQAVVAVHGPPVGPAAVRGAYSAAGAVAWMQGCDWRGAVAYDEAWAAHAVAFETEEAGDDAPTVVAAALALLQRTAGHVPHAAWVRHYRAMLRPGHHCGAAAKDPALHCLVLASTGTTAHDASTVWAAAVTHDAATPAVAAAVLRALRGSLGGATHGLEAVAQAAVNRGIVEGAPDPEVAAAALGYCADRGPAWQRVLAATLRRCCRHGGGADDVSGATTPWAAVAPALLRDGPCLAALCSLAPTPADLEALCTAATAAGATFGPEARSALKHAVVASHGAQWRARLAALLGHKAAWLPRESPLAARHEQLLLQTLDANLAGTTTRQEVADLCWAAREEGVRLGAKQYRSLLDALAAETGAETGETGEDGVAGKAGEASPLPEACDAAGLTQRMYEDGLVPARSDWAALMALSQRTPRSRVLEVLRALRASGAEPPMPGTAEAVLRAAPEMSAAAAVEVAAWLCGAAPPLCAESVAALLAVGGRLGAGAEAGLLALCVAAAADPKDNADHRAAVAAVAPHVDALLQRSPASWAHALRVINNLAPWDPLWCVPTMAAAEASVEPAAALATYQRWREAALPDDAAPFVAVVAACAPPEWEAALRMVETMLADDSMRPSTEAVAAALKVAGGAGAWKAALGLAHTVAGLRHEPAPAAVVDDACFARVAAAVPPSEAEVLGRLHEASRLRSDHAAALLRSHPASPA